MIEGDEVTHLHLVPYVVSRLVVAHTDPRCLLVSLEVVDGVILDICLHEPAISHVFYTYAHLVE